MRGFFALRFLFAVTAFMLMPISAPAGNESIITTKPAGTTATNVTEIAPLTRASGTSNSEVAPFAVEYYYKIRWGYSREFWQLFNRNHYPILLKQKEQGRILEIKAEAPFYHANETDRWDYRVTIVWRNASVAHDDYDGADIIPVLYPDQERFRKEELRRFELMLAHWDVVVTPARLVSR